MVKKRNNAAAAAAAAPARVAKSPSTSRGESSTRMLVMIATGALVTFLVNVFISSQTLPTPPEVHTLEAGRYNVTCLDSYPSIGVCSPPQTCGRILVDDFISPSEVAQLRAMAELGMSFGSGAGGPTIFDVATGAASKGEAFIDAYAMMAQSHAKAIKAADAARPGSPVLSTQPKVVDPATHILSASQLALYRSTTRRIESLISREFGVRDLYLTSPSFFSRITAAEARTTHDEYWHEHVDKLQYQTFMYTALVYLSDHGTDFDGGEFRFIDKDASGEVLATHQALPQRGRVMAFTSGAENAHYVSRVTRGVRHALTIAFTCDRQKSVEATLFQKAEAMLRTQQEWTERAKTQQEEGTQTIQEETIVAES